MGRMVAQASCGLRGGFNLRVARSFTRNTGAAPVRVGHRAGGGKLEPYRSHAAHVFSGPLNETRLDNHLPKLRPSFNRDNANRRLPVLLRMQRLRVAPQAESGRLLRFLLLWRRAVPADSGGQRAWSRRRMLLLRRIGQKVKIPLAILQAPQNSKFQRSAPGAPRLADIRRRRVCSFAC